MKHPRITNGIYYIIGILFLFANKIRHSLLGYKTPKTFPVSMINETVEYDLQIIKKWEKYFKLYTGNAINYSEKTILEIGPGDNLGVGVVLLCKGAKKYHAVDVVDLAKKAPIELYQHLINRINESILVDNHIDCATFIEDIIANRHEYINFVCDRHFNLNALDKEGVDVIYSNAAFEHLDDFGKTIKELSNIAKTNCIMVSEVDLKTHTRWIRKKDPNNIYRYNEIIYAFTKFKGSPNRMRPKDYVKVLRDNGWGEIKIFPITKIDAEKCQNSKSSLNKRFRDEDNQMDILTMVICATKIR